MRVFKKGNFYHYEFEFRGARYQGSTRRKNEREARQIAAAKQFEVVKSSVGLGASKEPAPTVRQFQKTFEGWVTQDIEDQATREFYTACYRRLIECPHTANIRLDALDEALIEKFKTWSLSLDSVRSKSTVNRYLATLSKALHFACDKLRLIDKVPKIHKFPKSKTCERERDFTFSDAQYAAWIETAPEPLRSASVLARESGMSRNELLALEKDAVHLTDAPDQNGFFGQLEVKRGLKRMSRKRSLPVTAAMRDVILLGLAQSKCKHVLTCPESPGHAVSRNTLADQTKRTRVALKLQSGVGLHALRHTFLTSAGKLTQNVKALQLLAGHANVSTTMRYIHPERSDVFGIVAAMKQRSKATAQAAGD